VVKLGDDGGCNDTGEDIAVGANVGIFMLGFIRLLIGELCELLLGILGG
jgi:hypothetical protein